MINEQMFMGQGGFYWWFGTVEDNGDPLGIGRCRVRIAGWHNPNDQELQTTMLPWAYAITPITNAAVAGIGISPSGPLPGTRVFGFFMDGLTGQQPIMLGTVPGGSEYEYRRGLQYGSTPWQPNGEKLLGETSTFEGDCPDGYDNENANSNLQVPDQRQVVSSGDWVLPTTGFVSSAYNEARGNGTHHGVDICPAGFFKQTDPGAAHLNGRLRGPVGQPIYAAAAGVVSYIWTADKGQGGVKTFYDKTGQGSRSYGNAVAIKHTLSSGTYTTIYAHLGINQDAGQDQPGAGINVKIGQSVGKGQQIGTMGRTHVYDSLTHLHFEIRIGTALPKANNHINPGRVFPQLANKHTSFLSWANSQTNYNVDKLPFKVADAPVIGLQGPASV